jgi:superfamily II DNA or RNA helicase/HKD family nuclease
MASLIDNESKTLRESLSNALSSANRVDIHVAYFFLSGFKSLAKELANKHIRILVGMEIDPNAVSKINSRKKEENVDLSRYQPEHEASSTSEQKRRWIEACINFVNDSDLFDKEDSIDTLELFLKKIDDGTLEIRKTQENDHAKYYILHNADQYNQNGDFPGTVFMGSSNLTYSGLEGQGELNDSFREKSRFEDYLNKFESHWDEATTIVDQENKYEFEKEFKERVWLYAKPSPYHIYLRVLDEIFEEKEENIKTPGAITDGRFADFEYQLDAIRMGLDRIHKYDGAIIADVVGLGKSIIASAIARNLNLNTVIIAPPHLIPQWEDYKEHFGIRGSKVFSSGKIEEVYERYKNTDKPILLILDEAHRYRNEDTKDYRLLHQISRSYPENKVILLSATPFNNDPKDVFALIKLFQTPGQSTIRSVDNLSLRFRELIDRYKKLRRKMRDMTPESIRKEGENIAEEQRRLIETVVIRRSRLDLQHITRYKKDLKKQNVSFPEIKGPELLTYNLGQLSDLYTNTLRNITGENTAGFMGARYKPSTYVKDRKKFIEKYGEYLDETDLVTAQTNLAQFMRRLLVMRFESSKAAFQSTLSKMLESNKRIEEWWESLGKVPIMKKGAIPDVQDFTQEDGEEDALSKELEDLKKQKNLIAVEKDMIEDSFIEDVRSDIKILQDIYNDWFEDSKLAEFDPKIDEVLDKINKKLRERPDRKIVIFSAYADTVEYLSSEFGKRGVARVLKYTAADASAATKRTVVRNFDASLPEEEQENEYDIIITTDALSEGFNLHRAGIVVNYDIPYNPTRVIQRIGRINRINKKVFDKIYIFNFFPTAVGESEIRVKSISTLKIQLINNVLGSDTPALSSDEELESFFKDEFERVENESEQLSWDAEHREVLDKLRQDNKLLETVRELPRRSRIKRIIPDKVGTVVFGKKGEHSIFTLAKPKENPCIVSTEKALEYFQATEEETAEEVGEDFLDDFNLAKETLFAKHELPQIRGRRADAIKNLEALAEVLPKTKDYCKDIMKIIKTLDDIDEGTLKSLATLDLSDQEEAYTHIKNLVPEHFIQNVLERSRRDAQEGETVLFAERFTS